jgi:hypothetical protein
MGTRAEDQTWMESPALPPNHELLGFQGGGPIPTFPVTVEGPVQSQALPTRGGATIQRKVTTVADHILNEDPRRSRVLLISKDDDMYVAFDQQSVQSGVAAIWPKLVPLTITCTSGIWVAAVTTTSVISAVPEQWTH